MRLPPSIVASAFVLLAACGGGGGDKTPTTTPPNTNQTLSSIRLPSSTIALAAGGSSTITASALDAAGRVISGATGYTFVSGTPGVAEVQPSGALLAISAGTSTVTVSLTRDGVTATATATVTVTGSLPAAASIAAGTDNTFTPATVVVARNATVSYDFGSIVHNATFRSATGAPANIGNTSAATVTRTFPTAGDFTYDCSLHAGMTGQVIVR